MGKETTKLRGNFVTIEEIGAALFFAFMAGACLTGLYFDLIVDSHQLPKMVVEQVKVPIPCGQQQQPQHGPPPYRFRQFH